ncbi:hypothetical protein [Arthrobacter sp. NPDC058127]|uniref:hypothetical protein n=1 Tax=Arthrobacter sp. NPDC058127 TaxID=3346351 RepID=UPI0036E96669
MDFWIPLLGGALGAAIINGVFAYFRSKHDKLTEHGRWLRDQQATAYAALIDSTREASQWVLSAYKIESEQERHEQGLAVLASLKSGHLVMLAPDATLKAADDMINNLYEFAQEVTLNGYTTGSPQLVALHEAFGAKQMVFNGRCRADVRSPK